MQHTQSLCENNRFRYLYRRGKTASAPSLVVYASKNRLKTVSRLGITCSVKLGGAVQRNRMRRRIRECYRLCETQCKPGYDIVVVARAKVLRCPFSMLQKDMLALFAKLGLLAQNNEKSDTATDSVYRRHLSGLKRAPTCRFIPTCSQYAIEAIEKIRCLQGGRLGAVARFALQSFLQRGL